MTPQWFLHWWNSTYRSSHRWCSIKKVFLKISQKFQENICVEVSFLIKLPPTLSKKRLQLMCFPVNFTKSLRAHFLQKSSGQLLLQFNGPTITLNSIVRVIHSIYWFTNLTKFWKLIKMKFPDSWKYRRRYLLKISVNFTLILSTAPAQKVC